MLKVCNTCIKASSEPAFPKICPIIWKPKLADKVQSSNQSKGHLCTLILPEDHTWGGLLLFQHESLSEGVISHFLTAALRGSTDPFDGSFFRALRSDGKPWLVCQCTHTGWVGEGSCNFFIHDYYVILYFYSQFTAWLCEQKTHLDQYIS